MRFDTKIAVILRAELPVWQQLNMTAFLTSGIAATVEEVVGQPYEDGSDVQYLPMFRQPVVIFGATAEQLRSAYERARTREVRFAVFTDDLFETNHDEANRAAVKAWPSGELRLAGMALYADRKVVDAITKGLSLHA